MSGTDFLEIEHKFLVDAGWDVQAFHQRLASLGYQRSTQVAVTDTYYITAAVPGHIYRHRYDQELQQLTVKSLTADPEVRLEVNLELGHEHGPQAAAVAAFLKPLDVLWTGTLAKKVWAYYFADCEVVYYQANYGDDHVACVEVEAIGASDLGAAKETLRQYEYNLGFQPEMRTSQSLFDLLLKPHLPQDMLWP